MNSFQTHIPPAEQTTTKSPDSSEQLEKQRLQSQNPSDGSVVGEVELTPDSATAQLLERATDAQRAWQRRPLDERIKIGRRLFRHLLKWRRELIELLVDETGKSDLEARWELWKTCQEMGHILDGAKDEIAAERRRHWLRPHRVVESRWQPRGVVLVVASAYEPLQTTVAPALAAVVAGNSVIIVADERSPLVVKSASNIAAGAASQEALWTGVVGGRRLVDGLADRVDAVVSYGPPMMTRRLARRQGDRMIPVLGRWPTRNAMVVLNDADMERASRAAVVGSCSGGGRIRRAVRRIYVQQSVSDIFVDAVIEQMGTLRQADDVNGGRREVGPLFESRDLERMESLVDDACRNGARLVAGGRPRPRCRGSYFEPTVLTGVDESMRLWREDAPGPVVAIADVQAPAEAVRRVREVPGGGAVSIFTANRHVADQLAGRLGTPVVGINEVVDELPKDAPPMRSTFDGPLDPSGADRLRALSRRIVKVERGLSLLTGLLETRSPGRAELALDAAISVLHRRHSIRSAIESVLPGR